MQHSRFYYAAVSIIMAAFVLSTAGCSSNSAAASATPTMVMPQPQVESVVASTSGTQSAYFATLDITVKNNGSEGVVLVKAGVTQNGKTTEDEMPVFLGQGESHSLKMTFPLVWQGGNFSSNVQAVIP